MLSCIVISIMKALKKTKIKYENYKHKIAAYSNFYHLLGKMKCVKFENEFRYVKQNKKV